MKNQQKQTSARQGGNSRANGQRANQTRKNAESVTGKAPRGQQSARRAKGQRTGGAAGRTNNQRDARLLASTMRQTRSNHVGGARGGKRGGAGGSIYSSGRGGAGGVASGIGGALGSLLKRPVTKIVLVLVVLALLIFVVKPVSCITGVLGGVAGGGADTTEQPTEAHTYTERAATLAAYTNPAASDLDSMEPNTSDTAAGFTLTGDGAAPEISEDSQAAITAAEATLAESGYDTAYMLMDISTGRGLYSNIDQAFYGASTFKAPFCLYVLSQQVDAGEATLSSTMKSNMTETIVNSNNKTYVKLRNSFDDSGLATWLSSLGIDQDEAYDTSFPTYSVRDGAKLWMEMYKYIEAGSENAEFLAGLLGTTEKSFIRDAVKTNALSTLTGQQLSGYDTDADDDATASDNEEDAESAASAAETDSDSDAASEVVVTSTADQETGTTLAVAADTVDYTPEVRVAYTSDKDINVNAVTSLESAAANVAQAVKQATIEAMVQVDDATVTVLDKAGWIASSKSKYNAIADYAIVTYGGRDYLMCVMTSAPYTNKNVKNVETLMTAIFNARKDLI